MVEAIKNEASMPRWYRPPPSEQADKPRRNAARPWAAGDGARPPWLLTSDEETLLDQLVVRVRNVEKGYVAAGQALIEIQTKQLYRQDWVSFPSFCLTIFGYPRSHAYRLMEAARVVQALVEAGFTLLPFTERQARRLAAIPEEKRSEIWKSIVKEAVAHAGKESNVSACIMALPMNRFLPLAKRKPTTQARLGKALKMVAWMEAKLGADLGDRGRLFLQNLRSELSLKSAAQPVAERQVATTFKNQNEVSPTGGHLVESGPEHAAASPSDSGIIRTLIP